MGKMPGTKALTLKFLSGLVKKSKIEKIEIITAGEYASEPGAVCEKIRESFGGGKIVVRSSTSNEDSYVSSNAGHYESVLDVDSSDTADIADAIETVIASYRDVGDTSDEQILIQSQMEGAAVSGVVFTREMQGNLPYFLINYDDKGSTDLVTSGRGGKTLLVARDADFNALEKKWKALTDAVLEIEDILNDSILDIEYAINEKDEVTIFQVRPLAASRNGESAVDEGEFFGIKKDIIDCYTGFHEKYDGMADRLSDMAFWNPAEIIGTNPRPLDYSLYREIVTKDVWSIGLVPMGYRLVPHELMYRLGNKPFISLDYSFYGLIPSDIDDGLAKKLVGIYEARLGEDLTAHDKIEFEIVLSTCDFSTDERIEKLKKYGLSDDEGRMLKESLFNLTLGCVRAFNRTLDHDRALINSLNASRDALRSEMIFKYRDSYANTRIDKSPAYVLGEIISLLELLKKCGTTPFTRQARYAFMAKSFCASLVQRGFFSQREIDDFMKSIHTISSDFDLDFAALGRGELSRERFNKKYGHLRSGTYNIRSRRYDIMDFDNIKTKTRRGESTENQGGALDEGRLALALDSIGFDISPGDFADFLKRSMEEREYFKFEFTRTLSFAIELIAIFGVMLGFDRKDMAYVTVDDLRKLNSMPSRDMAGARDYLSGLMQQRRRERERNEKVILPDVIRSKNDIDIMEILEARPNFITSKVVEGEVVVLKERLDADIEGKIVALDAADPGYEWIFAKGIKGFITKYGGVASHMAIRCAEFNIPGAIGCGEKIYSYVCRQDYIRLDCRNGKIN